MKEKHCEICKEKATEVLILPLKNLDVCNFHNFPEIQSLPNDILPKHRDILELRYGLDDGKPKTLSEISKIKGVNRTYVQTVERRWIYKMRRLKKTSIVN